MLKRVIIRNGKKYIVNVPDWGDFVGDDLGIWMEFTGSIVDTNYRILEDGDIRITEDGFTRIVES